MIRTVTSADGVPYRDLNRNGVLDPYEDPRRSPEERVADLLPRLSLEEKAGLLFHTIIGVGEAGGARQPGRLRSRHAAGYGDRAASTTSTCSRCPPRATTARWQNAVQELAGRPRTASR